MFSPSVPSPWLAGASASAPRLRLTHFLLALVAGLAQAASIAWPFPLQVPGLAALSLNAVQPVWWLQLLALTCLAWLLGRCQGWRPAALTGWVFATAWLAGTFWWTFIALHTYGGLPAILGVLAVLALAGLLALYYGLVCGLFRALAGKYNAWSALVFASLWLLAEMARGRWLTGFGWGAVGYAHVDGPLAAFAPWVGVYGLCALSAWVAMTLAQEVVAASPARGGVRRNAWGQAGLSLLAVLALLSLPHLHRVTQPAFTTATGTLAVTLLQGNIPQDEKFEIGTGVPQALRWYAEQLQNSRTPLVIAPETAIPVLPQQLPLDYWDALQRRFASGSQAALIGMPLGDAQMGYTNSVIGLKPGQAEPWRYDKHHLVPFGEFIPPFFKWFTEMMNIPLGDFNRGPLGQAPFEWQGQRLAANICYEDLFSEELGLLFADPTRDPTIFVNVSNLAWYGQSLAMDQHLQIARLRAKEFERPFLLATNTGITAIVDHQGRVTSALARDTRAVLVGEVQGRTGTTPYAGWVARFGLWPLWLLACSLVALAWALRLRKR